MLGRYSGDRAPVLSPATPRIMFYIGRLEPGVDTEIRRAVHEALMSELTRNELSHDLSDEEEMLVLDCLVTEALIYGDERLRSRLDEWSLRAFQLGPQVKPILGTRGGALVELGRPLEGKALLKTEVVANDADPFGAIMRDIFLARAEYALGEAETARRLIASVRRAAAAWAALAPGVTALIARTDKQIVFGS